MSGSARCARQTHPGLKCPQTWLQRSHRSLFVHRFAPSGHKSWSASTRAAPGGLQRRPTAVNSVCQLQDGIAGRHSLQRRRLPVILPTTTITSGSAWCMPADSSDPPGCRVTIGHSGGRQTSAVHRSCATSAISPVDTKRAPEGSQEQASATQEFPWLALIPILAVWLCHAGGTQAGQLVCYCPVTPNLSPDVAMSAT